MAPDENARSRIYAGLIGATAPEQPDMTTSWSASISPPADQGTGLRSCLPTPKARRDQDRQGPLVRK
jgi:hypothetical protein